MFASKASPPIRPTFISPHPTPKPVRSPKAIDTFLQPLFKLDADRAALRDLVWGLNVVVLLREAFVCGLFVALLEGFLRKLPMAAGELDDAEADKTHWRIG